MFKIKLIYYIFIVFIILYFIKTKYKDLFLFSIIFSIIYFLPTFFGYVTIKYNNNIYYQPIDMKLYIIHFIFMITMFLFHIIRGHGKNYRKERKVKIVLYNDFMAKILYKLWFVFFLMNIVYLKGNILSDKTQLSEGVFSYFNAVYYLLLVYSMVTNYKTKKYNLFFTQLPALLITYLQNHRSFVVYILVAIFINEIIINKKNIIKPKYIIFVIFIFLFGFHGKTIISSWRMGQPFSYIISNVIFNVDRLIMNIENSEPFTTQFILNKTITSNFLVSPFYILRYVLKMLFISPDIFIKIPDFYSQFVSAFVPNINYGIAYNIFSVPYSLAGIFGTTLFTIIYGIIIDWLNKLIRSKNDMIASMALSLSSIYCFYIFRNDIENIILWTQIFVGLFLFCFFIQIIKNRMKIKVIRYDNLVNFKKQESI